jgi:hypothetical protein
MSITSHEPDAVLHVSVRVHARTSRPPTFIFLFLSLGAHHGFELDPEPIGCAVSVQCRSLSMRQLRFVFEQLVDFSQLVLQEVLPITTRTSMLNA